MKLKFWAKDSELGNFPGDGKDLLSGSSNQDSLTSPSFSSSTSLSESNGSSFSNDSSTPSSFSHQQNNSFSETGDNSNTPLGSGLGSSSGSGSGNNIEKDLNLINAKLDAIKAMIESLSQRVIKIEGIADDSQKPVSQKVKEPQYRW